MPRQTVRAFGAALSLVDVTATVANSTSTNLANNFTIASWFRNNKSAGNYSSILQKSDTTTGYQIRRIGTGDTITVRMDTSGGSDQNSSEVEIMNGKWRHLAYSFASGICKTYVDGVLRFTDAYTHGTGFANAAVSTQWGSSGIKAFFDKTVLYARVLTYAEVTSLYLGETVSSTSLAGQWDFTEGAGGSFADSSGNANTGTNNGGWTTDTPMAARSASAARTGATGRTSAIGLRGILKRSPLTSVNDNDNNTLWFPFGDPPVTTTFSASGVTITPGTNSTGYGGVVTTGYTPSLYSTRITVKTVQVATLASNAETQLVFGPLGDEDNKVVFSVSNGGQASRFRTAGVNDDQYSSYSATADLWWRIEEQDGYVTMSSSPDDVTYTIKYAKQWRAGNLAIGEITLQAGTYDMQPTPGYAQFADLRLERIQPK